MTDDRLPQAARQMANSADEHQTVSAGRVRLFIISMCIILHVPQRAKACSSLSPAFIAFAQPQQSVQDEPDLLTIHIKHSDCCSYLTALAKTNV